MCPPPDFFRRGRGFSISLLTCVTEVFSGRAEIFLPHIRFSPSAVLFPILSCCRIDKTSLFLLDNGSTLPFKASVRLEVPGFSFSNSPAFATITLKSVLLSPSFVLELFQLSVEFFTRPVLRFPPPDSLPEMTSPVSFFCSSCLFLRGSRRCCRIAVLFRAPQHFPWPVPSLREKVRLCELSPFFSATRMFSPAQVDSGNLSPARKPPRE